MSRGALCPRTGRVVRLGKTERFHVAHEFNVGGANATIGVTHPDVARGA